MTSACVWYDTSMIVLALIVFGLIFGSFLNALTWRLHEHRDWVRERSECLRCHHTLGPLDLVPVLSWVLLGGKCRYCHKPIPDSPLVELAVPILFVLSYVYWPVPLQGQGLFDFACWLVFVIGFVGLAVYDIRWFLLPDKIIFPLMGLSILQVLGDWLLFHHQWQLLGGPLIGAVLISGIFYLLYFLSNGKWIGFGDVKLGIILGLLAGGALKALLVLLSASLIGTLIALPLLIRGKADRKTHLPFGPLLLAGMIIVSLWGTPLVGWYVGLFAA
jgi:prepilin signal peptidase PulO-like enzyme (type II secretory pathway)